MSRHLVATMTLALLAQACTGRGEASLVVDFVNAADAGSLTGLRARLTLTDAKGEHPALTLQVAGAEQIGIVAQDVPLPCSDSGCEATILVDPGSYSATMVVSALDRCRVRADIMTLEGQVDVDHWERASLVLTPTDASFDADDDGVIDVIEASQCGRFDLDEGAAPPRQCAQGREACCPQTASVVGGQMQFAGGIIELPYDRDDVVGPDVVDVSPFAIDSTEFTWGALARCVGSGVCLANRSDHPARQVLAAGIDPRLPVQGLSPIDAAVACAWAGRRLPTDAEWFFAAADRGGTTATYPFDDGATIGCTPADPPPAARYRASGRACGDGAPLPVGSFTTSYVDRGVGVPIADLAGNVAEWTTFGAVVGIDDNDDGLLDGAQAIGLRGGGATSFVQFLENDLFILFDLTDDVNIARLAAAAEVAGFRCASDAAIVVNDEPACPAPEASNAEGVGATGDDGR